MASSWDKVGQAASVMQVTGVDAFGLVSMIMQAAHTARRNRDLCQQLAQHVLIVADLLRKLDIPVLRQHLETRRPLELLDAALFRAYKLVRSCADQQENTSQLYQMFTGTEVDSKLRLAQEEIDRFINLIPMITLVAAVGARQGEVQEDVTSNDAAPTQSNRFSLQQVTESLTFEESPPQQGFSIEMEARRNGREARRKAWHQMIENVRHGLVDRVGRYLTYGVESVSSYEVSMSSEKVPPTPHRIPPSPSRFAPSPQIARVGSVDLSIQQILRATQNFSPSFKLGEGGFGMVYRAVLTDGNVVAVKRAKKDQFAGPRDEFSNEVDLLAKIDHRNLVRLLGFTDKGNERIIITEYVPNGTLREHLDGQHGRILDFNQRLEIAIDVAHALTYLHLYAEKTIIHRDVKSSNILLTDSYRAKVSDFGFARSGPSDTEKTHISTKVKGTAGYLDPEYLRTYQLTSKSDVFSFGILLVEILSARRPVELKRTPEERITIRWTFKKFNEGNMREILDPLLEDHVDDEVLEKLLSLAFQCAAPTRDDRPTMKEVGEQLWEIRKEYGKSIRKV